MSRSLTGSIGGTRGTLAVEPRAERRLTRWARILAGTVVGIGLLVLVGWTFDLPSLKSVLTGSVTMKVNTALALIAAGLALLLQEDRFPARYLVILVVLGPLLLGGATLVQTLAGVDLRIDRLFADEAVSVLVPYPGRMATITALLFLVASFAFLATLEPGSSARRLPEICAGVGLVVSALSFVSYLLGAFRGSTIEIATRMSVHTALAFGALFAGLLLRRQVGTGGLLVSETEAGDLARRLLPVLVVVPIFFAWLRLKAQECGWFGTGFGIAILVVAMSASLVAAIFFVGSGMARAEERRREADLARENLEEQLRQAQKMESIGMLAGGIAHDFNNMLTVINGRAELALIAARADCVACPVVADAEEILRAGERAADLTRQLLAFGRKQILEVAVVDLNRIVEDLSRLLGRLLGETIVYETRLSPDLVPVRVDASQISQVVMNLVINARDAMIDGGQLLVETVNVDLSDEYAGRHLDTKPGRHAMIAVTDTGCGMDEETRLRIFEPFFTTKERGKGTGLGLASVYGIVRQSGGTIFVYSEPGRGTTFKVYFPAVAGTASVVPAASDRLTTPAGHEVILVVEDEPSVRELAASILSRRGYDVLVASDGEEALAQARVASPPIDLLLTDVIMPGKSGRELEIAIRGIVPGLVVLFMSGYTDNSIVHQGVLEPGVWFLQKPFTAEKLCAKVREVLDGRPNLG